MILKYIGKIKHLVSHEYLRNICIIKLVINVDLEKREIMNEYTKVEKTERGKIIKAYCRKCKNETNHEIITDYNLSGQEPMGHESFFCWESKYQIISCQGCDSVSFRETELNSEDYEQISQTEWANTIHIDIYPDPIEGRNPLDDSYLIPMNLKNIYTETLKSINSNQPILTGIGIRAIVESVCKDQNTKGKGLENKINDLVSQGVLTKNDAGILHKLRIMGNKSAHEVQQHTAGQLNIAMDVIDHLLSGVYILPRKAKRSFE